MVRRHLFRYKYVRDNDGLVLRFHNKENVREHLNLTKWHLDHALLSPDLYRERIGGLLFRIHENWEGNDVKVRHVDQRFRRSDLESEPEIKVCQQPQRHQFALHRGAVTTITRDDTKPKPKSLPFLRMYKHTNRPVDFT